MRLPRNDVRISLFLNFIQHAVEHRWEYLSANKGGSIPCGIERIDMVVHGGFPWNLHHFSLCNLLLGVYVRPPFLCPEKKWSNSQAHVEKMIL
jgi:hypothetical protein